MMRSTAALTSLISLGCLLATKVDAASLEISPVMVTLATGQTAAVIEVQNRGDSATAVQARAYSWTQAGDDDALTPTHDIILSPPIFTLPRGASQTVRLLLRGGGGAGGERSYRLLLDEVPAANAGNKQIVIALRVSLPVIAASASPTPPTLQWRAERGAGGETVLTAVNTGQAYDRVGAIDVTLSDGSHPKVVARGTNTYVLPAAQRHWSVQGSGGASAGPLRLSVTTQAGKSVHTLAP
jgi:fimbrial chaperone protein